MPLKYGWHSSPPPNCPVTADMELAARIARRLSELRRQYGLSQEAVGQLLDTSQATVSRWEDEASASLPSALEVSLLARHCGVSADWLLGISEHRESLPEGEALVDQALLDAFAGAKSPEELEEVLANDISFGALWVQIPDKAKIMSVREARAHMKTVGLHVQALDSDLWKRWAKLVLG